MCTHTRTLTYKRNAVVCLRRDLQPEFRSTLSEELSRHENYYDWLIDLWQENCPVCYEIAYSDHEDYDLIENRWDREVCSDLEIWGKSITYKVEPVMADWEKELLSEQN